MPKSSLCSTEVSDRGGFGCILTDQAANRLSRDDAAAMAMTIAKHGVVVLRGGDRGDAALSEFLQSLGEPMFTDGETPVPGFPTLNIVSNVGRTTPPRSVFHTDTSYVARPPAFTALRAVALPTRGGATLFSDQRRAAAALPARLRHCLAHARVLHRASGVADATTNWHPLFRRHPLTGETALYLSTPARCVAIEGLEDDTAARVIDVLYRNSARAGFVYRHAWQPGDVVIWDNRVTMHRADHDGVVGDRVLHRGMVRGEAPLSAD
jgi:taurine dioxygenase